MFNKLHLFSQDSPDASDEFRYEPQSYLRLAGTLPKGPAQFEWSERQLTDLEELWLEPENEGARHRLAKDLTAFGERLGWSLKDGELQEAEGCGEEVLITVSSAAPELYILPWEVVRLGASDRYLSDISTALVRYCVPGFEPSPPLDAPPNPGVLFAWSDSGGAVPHAEQAGSIQSACQAAGVSFQELAGVNQASLQAALEDDPPSVLHILCHGMPGPEGEPARLCWGSGKDASEVTASRLARLLRRHKASLRLIVLSACGSGDGQGDVLYMSSLAQGLHKEGIPNVVASRYPLSVRGSQVMVRALYDKLLGEAWSLERSLQHARNELFNPDEDGRSYPGDAYGVQLYAHDTERFVSRNGVEAERPVLASYPFGTAEQPTPESAPPRKDSTIELKVNEKTVRAAGKATGEQLCQAAEDPSLTYKIKRAGTVGALLLIDTTVDGAQRLLAAWRSGELADDTGFKIVTATVAKPIKPPLPASGVTGAKAANIAKVGGVGAATQAAELGAVSTEAGAVAAAGAGQAGSVAVGMSTGAKALTATLVAAAAIATGVLLLGPGDDPPTAPPDAMPDAAWSGGGRARLAVDAAPVKPDPPDARPTPDARPIDARVATVAPRPPRKKPPVVKPPVQPPAKTTLSKPRVKQEAGYYPDEQEVEIEWSIPKGAAGVLVVESFSGKITGTPTPGQTYQAGSRWPHGANAKVSVFGRKSKKIWKLPPGKVIWLSVWAFDDQKQYSGSDSFTFKP